MSNPPDRSPDPGDTTASDERSTEGASMDAYPRPDSPSLAFLREVANIAEAPAPFDPAIFGPRFQVRQRLGVGGFGAVYEAYDQERSATVALKVLRRLDGASVSRFKHEFRALAETSHPNLVQLYELHAEGETWFFTMERVRGAHALDDLRPPAGPADEARLRSVFHQLATGLCFLHRSGKLHRDIKPSNVMVTPEGRVVLVDFGLVQVRAEPEVGGAIVGTPAYMAPEQAAGAPVDEAADWYAVGVMLYQALTGRLPPSGVYSASPGLVAGGVPADLDQLCRSLLARAAGDRPRGREVLRVLAPRVDPEAPALPPEEEDSASEPGFVGRETQLAALRQALAATSRGQITAALVRGPAGMGKSALLRQFLADLRAEEPRRLALFGRCFEQESVPYKGVDGLLEDLGRHLAARQRAGIASPLPPDASSLARLFPRLGELLGVRPEPVAGTPDGLLLRAQGFAALRALLCPEGAPAPVLVVDDLQWGDPDSVALLAALLGGTGTPAPLLVCAYRAEDAELSDVLRALFAALHALGERVTVRHIEVDRLDPAEAEALSRALLATDGRSGAVIAEDAVAALITEGQGNPLLLAELSRRGPTAGAPDLRALLAARIDRLPAAARHLLEIVAVDGQPLARAVAALATAGDGGPSQALGAVSLLRAQRLIRGRISAHGEEILAYHDRIGEVVRAGLAADRARGHHLRLAGAFETLGAREPERLLYHYKGAGRPSEAARCASQAAARAHEALAFDRAARLYREALALRGQAREAEPPPDDTEAAQDRPLRVSLAEALTAAGRPRDAAAAYLDAARGASPSETQPLSRRAAELLLGAGYVDEGLATIRQVLRPVGIRLPTSLPRSLLGYAWHRLRLGLRGLGFRERPEHAVADRDLRRIDACYSATLGLFLVNPILAGESQGRHLLLALDAGEPRRVARALGTEAIVVAVRQGAGAATDRLLATASEIEARVADPRLTGFLRLCRGHVAYTAGRWREGHDLLLACETLLRRECADAATEIDLARIQRSNLLWALGDLDTLRRLLPVLVEEAQERDSRLLEMMVRLGPAPNLALAEGRPDRARESIAAALERWPRAPGTVLHVRELGARARIALYERDPALALRAVEEGLAAMRRTGLRLVHSQTAELFLWRALAALSLGDLARAARDARLLARQRFRWASGAALFVQAGIAHRSGDLPAALDLLGTIRDRSRAGEMALYGVVMARRHGAWRGDGEGRAEVAAADAWLAARGVADPERLAGMMLGWV